MTIYSTDFSEYTIGVSLSDWNDFWAAGNFTYLAQANSGDYKVGNKECNYTVSSDSRCALTWDDIGDVADSDITAKINSNLFGANGGPRLYSRISGSSASENAYFATITTDSMIIVKYINGSALNLVTVSFAPKTNTNYWIRFQTVGSTLRAKIWSEGSIEPAEWKVSTSSGTQLTSGAVGFGGFLATVDFEVDYFSCGTGTDLAVFPPAGWTLSDRFGYVGDTDLTAAIGTSTRAMGGLISEIEKTLTGILINHDGHTTAIRVGVYSGGDLSTGLSGATLLHDFGEVASSTSPLELTCSPVEIPVDEPLWLIIKSSSSGFSVAHTVDPVNSGNYQIARGRVVLTGVGTDTSVSFPGTYPSETGTFSNFWYDWNIMIVTEEVVTAHQPIITILT